MGGTRVGPQARREYLVQMRERYGRANRAAVATRTPTGVAALNTTGRVTALLSAIRPGSAIPTCSLLWAACRLGSVYHLTLPAALGRALAPYVGTASNEFLEDTRAHNRVADCTFFLAAAPARESIAQKGSGTEVNIGTGSRTFGDTRAQHFDANCSVRRRRGDGFAVRQEGNLYVAEVDNGRAQKVPSARGRKSCILRRQTRFQPVWQSGT